jgi:hypothetical protein
MIGRTVPHYRILEMHGDGDCVCAPAAQRFYNDR